MAVRTEQPLRERIARFARPRAPEALPVTLNRKRVYILPTRFGLFISSLLITMLLGALNYNNNPALLLALLTTATFLASQISAHLQLSGLRIESFSAEPVHAGMLLITQIGLTTTDGRSRIGLQINNAHHHAVVPAIRHSAQVTATLALPTTTRGWLRPSRLRIFTTQPLGLARAWSWVWPETPLLVYPAIEVNGPPLPELGSNAHQVRADSIGEELHHLRAYRPGDSQHTIAWKPSARRDTLFVREYEQPTHREIALSWSQVPAMSYEARIQRLTHWVELAERTARRYSLHLPGQPVIGPAQGIAHRHQCLRALALLPKGSA